MVETVLREEIVIAPGAIKFLKKMSAKWRIFLLTAGADMRTKEVDVTNFEAVGGCFNIHKTLRTPTSYHPSTFSFHVLPLA